MTLDEKLQKEVESFRAKLADQGIRGKELEFAVREFARGHVAFRRYDQRVWARVREMEVPNIHRVPLVNLARRVYRLARANRGWFLAEQMAHHGAGLVGEGAHMDAVTAVLNPDAEVRRARGQSLSRTGRIRRLRHARRLSLT
jgi:hypothetical protein